MHSVQDKLRLLRDNYLQNLDKRRLQIDTSYRQLLAHWDSANLGEFHRLAHSLKGSAATFDLHKLSQAAARLENALVNLQALEGKPEARTLEHIDGLYTTLVEYLKNPDYDEAGQAQRPALALTNKKSKVLHSHKLTVLLTDDEEFGREQVSLMLQQDGHRVIQASNGLEAIALYLQETPDLIIMDVVMPEMNGYEAAREIKEISGQHFVPIIFLTGLTDDTELVECIENGGDDFLIKPVNPAILHARIYAMQRIRELNNRLFEYQSKTEDELNLAKHIFERITLRDSARHERMSYLNEPAGHFSGDFLIHKEVESGRYYVMLGDFTGHGLTAAIGAIPAADTFHTMAGKQAPLYAIAEEINRKLNGLLPTSQFLACTLVSVDMRSNDLMVLNCGLPSSYLFDESGEIVEEFRSSNLALGILKDNRYQDCVARVQAIRPGYHYLCFSDGLQEAHNHLDELYGNERIFASVRAASSEHFLEDIRRSLDEHIQGREQHDDITIMSVSF